MDILIFKMNGICYLIAVFDTSLKKQDHKKSNWRQAWFIFHIDQG